MSTDIGDAGDALLGGGNAPRLSETGRRIEMLRIARGISKQRLAALAGVSRQQLWRVMTGKAPFAGALRDRIAETLGSSAGQLASIPSTSGISFIAYPNSLEQQGDGAAALEAYLRRLDRLERSLRGLPSGGDGRRLKLLLLNALEEQAALRGVTIPAELLDLRRRVLASEL